MQQLFLNFPIKSGYALEDFYLNSSNSKAFNYINQWPNWGEGIYKKTLLIYGEKGSGKTHLSHIWQQISSAKIISLGNKISSNDSALILEDIDELNQEDLLHLINSSNEDQRYLLLTAKLAPAQLKISLPDLRSRIIAIPSLKIEVPDEELLKVILMKHLSDRQLRIEAAALNYIILRIDRSYAKLAQFIDKLDSISKESKRSITLPLIKQALNF